MGWMAFCAGRHLPAERLGSAGFYSGHYFELGQADMAHIGLPPRRTVFTENISNLQLCSGQTADADPCR
jgi:hypothetical protein